MRAGRDEAGARPPQLEPQEHTRLESMRLLREAWLASLENRMPAARALAQRALAVHPTNLQAQAFAAGLRGGVPQQR